MSTKAVLGVATVAVLAGGLWGYNAHPDTEVQTKHSIKIIRVPKYITHVKHETKTVYKPVGFPESCETAIDYVAVASHQANKVSTAVLKNRDITSDIVAQEHSYHVDDLNYQLLNTNSDVKTYYKLCMKDLKKAKDGDDFDAADGRHDVTP